MLNCFGWVCVAFFFVFLCCGVVCLSSLCLLHPMLSMLLDCPFFIVSLVFSNGYFCTSKFQISIMIPEQHSNSQIHVSSWVIWHRCSIMSDFALIIIQMLRFLKERWFSVIFSIVTTLVLYVWQWNNYFYFTNWTTCFFFHLEITVLHGHLSNTKVLLIYNTTPGKCHPSYHARFQMHQNSKCLTNCPSQKRFSVLSYDYIFISEGFFLTRVGTTTIWVIKSTIVIISVNLKTDINFYHILLLVIKIVISHYRS